MGEQQSFDIIYNQFAGSSWDPEMLMKKIGFKGLLKADKDGDNKDGDNLNSWENELPVGKGHSFHSKPLLFN